jgi:hypothetical protein
MENGRKCGSGSAGNATISGAENGPVKTALCCALLGSLPNATLGILGVDGACWCPSLYGHSAALLYLGQLALAIRLFFLLLGPPVPVSHVVIVHLT